MQSLTDYLSSSYSHANPDMVHRNTHNRTDYETDVYRKRRSVRAEGLWCAARHMSREVPKGHGTHMTATKWQMARVHKDTHKYTHTQTQEGVRLQPAEMLYVRTQ